MAVKMPPLHNRQLPREVLPTYMPLPIPSDYAKNMIMRWEMVRKGIPTPTFKMILKTYHPLPARQSPVHLQHPEFLSCLQSPMPCTEPESLGDDETKTASLGAQADRRKKEQLETSLSVQLDDMTGNHRDGEQNPLEQPQASEEEDKVVADGILHPDQGGKFCVQAEVGMDLKTRQVAARHFVLAMIQQQRGTTARSTDI